MYFKDERYERVIRAMIQMVWIWFFRVGLYPLGAFSVGKAPTHDIEVGSGSASLKLRDFANP